MTYYRRVKLTENAIEEELYQLRLWELELRERLDMVKENKRLKATAPSLTNLIKRRPPVAATY